MPSSIARYRRALPQLDSRRPFLTDGGLETTLLFLEQRELPEFAAFPLLNSTEGRALLAAYYERYLAVAARHQRGFILESPTWRASPRWGEALGLGEAELEALNWLAIAELQVLRERHEVDGQPIVISGNIGPQDDGYAPQGTLTAEAAEAYHRFQAQAFALSAADMLCAMTLTYAEEAVGITRAAAAVCMPVAIAFTVETDGALPSGQPLCEAIEQVDQDCAVPPVYYMINCAHPDHFSSVVQGGGSWLGRIRGLRVNASCKSHAELDAATELDQGNPQALACAHRHLAGHLPAVCVLGGCCGTTDVHVDAIARGWESR